MREGRSIPVPIRFSWLLALTFDKKLITMMKNDEVFGALKFWCDKENEIKFDSSFGKIIDTRLLLLPEPEAAFEEWVESVKPETHISECMRDYVKAIVKKQKSATYTGSTPIESVLDDFIHNKRMRAVARKALRDRLPKEQNSHFVKTIMVAMLRLGTKTDREYVAKLMCQSETTPDIFHFIFQAYECHPTDKWLSRAFLKHASEDAVEHYGAALIQTCGEKAYVIKRLSDDENYEVPDDFHPVDQLEIWQKARLRIPESKAHELVGILCANGMLSGEVVSRAIDALVEMNYTEEAIRVFDAFSCLYLRDGMVTDEMDSRNYRPLEDTVKYW